VATDQVALPMTVCFRSDSWLLDCEGTLTFTIDTNTMPYTLSTSTQGLTAATTGCFMEGEWAVEDEPFEIRHL
jgi:hypothetical protein